MVTEQHSSCATNVVSTEPGTPNEPGVTRLLAGIVDDVQGLLKTQMDLFQAEIQDDLRQTKEASTLLIAGALVLLLGGIFLGLMVVYLLHWAFPELNLWGAFGIVGAGLTLVGAVVFLLGKRKFASFNPLPDKSVAALKEAFNGRFRSHQTADGGSA